MSWNILNGDCLEVMRNMEPNSIDCIVTDPPYGLHFMGKDWDKFKNDHPKDFRFRNKEHNPRGRQHTCATQAGEYDDRRNDQFEDFVFTFGKEALRIVKPGSHILMFGAPRRFHRQTCGLEDAGWEIRDCLCWLFSGFPKSHNHFGLPGYGSALKPAHEPVIMAMKPLEGTYAQNAEKWGVAGINIEGTRVEGKRWPANLLLDEEAAKMLDQQSGIEASRFFYCAKASSRERGEDNTHPTIKPIALMQYLIKLVMPPNPDAVLLDPFAGSGTTIVAAKQLGRNATGIELSSEYAEIACKRIESCKIPLEQYELAL